MTVKVVTTPENLQHTVFIYTHTHTQEYLAPSKISRTLYVCCENDDYLSHSKISNVFSTVCACGLAIKILSQCISLFSFSVEIRLDAQSDGMLSVGKFYALSLSLTHSLSHSLKNGAKRILHSEIFKWKDEWMMLVLFFSSLM